MPNISELEKSLNKSLQEFKENVDFNYETFNGQYCTKDDMLELAKQTFYVLDEFKAQMMHFLNSI